MAVQPWQKQKCTYDELSAESTSCGIFHQTAIGRNDVLELSLGDAEGWLSLPLFDEVNRKAEPDHRFFSALSQPKPLLEALDYTRELIGP